MHDSGDCLYIHYGDLYKGFSYCIDVERQEKPIPYILNREKIKDELEVVTPSISTPVKNLSGGNVQKVLVGREIAASPTVLMTAYAVRGLDINTSYTIYHLLNEQKKKGSAVIFVGEDLDVMVALCDRIIVLCDGRINGVLEYKPDGDNKDFNKGNIGLMMTKIDYKDETEGGKADE